MNPKKTIKRCLVCDQTSDQLPLMALEYNGAQHWICSQHLPLLIHKPEQLIGKLKGVENLIAVEASEA
ncbi:MAG: hypothetical protein ABW082_06765 [Sedimenticola sp.]